MNRKLMAVAVAGAFAAPGLALAQTSTVQIGGSLNLLYYSHNPKNSSVAKKGDILEQSEPELRIMGTEKLGGGLSAWFQCASTFDVVGGTSTATGWCGRNSAIGLRGNFGNIFAGNWDVPYKFITNNVRGWFGGTATLIGGMARILSNSTSSGNQNVTGGGAATSFFRRQGASWHWHSPNWNGFTAQFAYSATNETTGIPTTNPLKPRMYSLAGQYTSGPLWVGVAYERHNDYNPGACTAVGTVCSLGTGVNQYSGGTDDSWTIGARYTFAKQFTLSGQYVRNEYETANGRSLDNRGWGVFAHWNVQGPHTLRAGYARIGDTKGNSLVAAGSYVAPNPLGGTGGNNWNLAYSYDFSKRTQGSLVYQRIKNDARTAGFSAGKTLATTGGSQQAFGINVRHRF